MSTWAWQSLRMLRAQPPGGVNSDERRAVFTAALEQSEELMRAAGDVGYSARPLPLFYSLSQAGRAVAAARLAGPAWRLARHGIGMRPDQDQIADLLQRSIRFDEESPKQVAARARRKSFAGVSDAIGSEVFDGSIELGAVWAAMPDLVEPVKQMPPPPQGIVWRRPLRAYPMVADTTIAARAERLMVMVEGLPAGLDAAEVDAELEHYVFERAVAVLTGIEQLVNARQVSQFDPMILTPAGPLVPPKQPDAPVTSFHDGVELPVLVFPEVVMMSQNQHPGFLDGVVPPYRQHPTRLFCPRLGEQSNRRASQCPTACEHRAAGSSARPEHWPGQAPDDSRTDAMGGWTPSLARWVAAGAPRSAAVVRLSPLGAPGPRRRSQSFRTIFAGRYRACSHAGLV